MQVEQPQVRVTIDGFVVPGATSVEVESCAYFSADRFKAEFAIGADGGASADYFAGLTARTINIDMALGKSDFVTILVGKIDNIRLDFLQNLVVLSGRDLSALMIDAEVSETFVNQTSSQIAQVIAFRHGLVPNVSFTTTPVGQYYEIDHARNALGMNARATTEWNLLAWLAQLENFSLSVSGRTLSFGPAVQSSSAILSLGDMMALNMDIATTIPTQTVVKSWNSRSKIAVSEAAGSSAGAVTTLIRPNLSAAQARMMAASHLSLLGQHGTILTASMPGELALAPNMQIYLDGTNCSLDQGYRIVSINRSLHWRTGFSETIRAYALTN